MPADSTMLLVGVIIALIVLVLIVPLVYKLMTGDSMQQGCKIFAKALWTIDILGFIFSPLEMVCNVIAPF
jgi:hypothetical protein